MKSFLLLSVYQRYFLAGMYKQLSCSSALSRYGFYCYMHYSVLEYLSYWILDEPN